MNSTSISDVTSLLGISVEPHRGGYKGFTQTTRASYYREDAGLLEKDVVEHFNIGFYYDEGGTTGEFGVVFERVGGEVVPRLLAYADGWHALLCMPELLALLGRTARQYPSQRKYITPDQFRANLIEIGFVDRTKTA